MRPARPLPNAKCSPTNVFHADSVAEHLLHELVRVNAAKAAVNSRNSTSAIPASRKYASFSSRIAEPEIAWGASTFTGWDQRQHIGSRRPPPPAGRRRAARHDGRDVPSNYDGQNRMSNRW